jgi:hypothetical protein
MKTATKNHLAVSAIHRFWGTFGYDGRMMRGDVARKLVTDRKELGATEARRAYRTMYGPLNG